jgi:hypothetical protein
MPRTRLVGNGKTTARVDRLEEAMATMLTTQAAFLSRTSEMDREMGAMRLDLDDMRSMMSGIMQQLDAVMRMIEKLPDAVKEKVGFRG